MKRLKRLVILLLLPGVVLAQANIPSISPGKLLQGWLGTFNWGDVAQRTKFIEEHYTEAVLDGAQPEQLARRALRFRETVGGGFDLYKISRYIEERIQQ